MWDACFIYHRRVKLEYNKKLKCENFVICRRFCWGAWTVDLDCFNILNLPLSIF